MLKGTYRPDHTDNRMKHEGDVTRARKFYFTDAPSNLRFLLRQRYSWMNRFIAPDDHGMEVGCGAGLSQQFIRCGSYLLTDLADYDWLDAPNTDALNTPFDRASFNFVVSSNMIHHVPHPQVFFNEMHRVLKPDGLLLIQEINASLVMRMVLRLMRHEGYSFTPDVFDEDVVCTDPNDLWSANCAIPNLLFDNPKRFEARVPGFRVIHRGFSEFSCFLNSGGVIAKTFCIPLPPWLLRVQKLFDDILTGVFPSVFALQRQIVLKRVQRPGVPVGIEHDKALSTAA